DCVEITVPAPDVDRVVDHCRRSVYHVFGGELPLQNTGLCVRRVHVAIAASKENLAVRQGWRGSEYVPSIRNGLTFGLKAVQVFCFKFALVLGREHPAYLAAAHLDRTQRSSRRNKIGESACYRGRGCDRHSRLVLPFLFSGLLIDGVEVTIQADDIDNAISDGWRGYDGPASFERPLDAPKLFRTRRIVDTAMGGIAVKHGL